MDKDFWHRRWKSSDIPFHERVANPLLVEYVGRLSLAKGGRVFLPLCGKTLDIGWLRAQGWRVAGAELSELAVTQLFAELEEKPELSADGKLTRYRARDIDIFLGDLFDLSAGQLGHVDAVYDRAALVALPQDMRGRYAKHLMEITGKAPQLLICYDYDQSLQEGPPFSVGDAEVKRHYGDHYHVTLLASRDVPGGLKGKCSAREKAWLLHP